MKNIHTILFILFGFLMFPKSSTACSVLYYIDRATGKIYIVNNEDYWYDVKAYIQIEPRSKSQLARLWYGWDNFAQGGINEAGLFFDAAVTPEQEKIPGYGHPKNNLGDKILAHCSNVEEALEMLENEKIALHNSHMMFGDKSGHAVVVEWINGERILHPIQEHKLIMTNYLLSDPHAGNYPCHRYESIERRIDEMESSGEGITLLKVGNTFGQAAQSPKPIENERVGGTVYTTFMDVMDNKFYLSYKLSNENVTILDLHTEFSKTKRQKIELKE